MRGLKANLWTTVAFVSTGACDFTHDSVAPGYYDNVATAGRAAVSAAGSGTKAGAPAASQTRPVSSSSMATAASLMSSSAGAPALAMTPAAPAAQPAATGSSSSCDLSGRWLLTVHKTTDGLGNLQYAHNFYYYEIKQQGDAFSVSKSLLCGTSVVGGGAFAVTVEFSGPAAAMRQHVSHNGRTGKSVAAANGCMVTFDKQYQVFGATLPHYLDPSTTLPGLEEPAADGKPGWEDWDGDGNPGITGVCSGTVTGKIFVAPREWTTLTGSVPNVSSVLKLSMNWDQEPNVISFDGSPFLGSSAVRAADASLHFAQLARLADDQATGDDAALCKNLMELAPALTPEAAGM